MIKRNWAVGLGLLAVAPAAGGQVVQNVCSSQAVVCAAAQFSLSNATTLEMLVYNGTTAASAATVSTITEIWFFNFAPVMTLTGASHFEWNTGTNSYDTHNATAEWTFGVVNSQGWMVGYTGKELNGPGGNGGITTCAGAATNYSGTNKKYQTCSTGTLFGGESDYVKFTFSLSAAAQINPHLLNMAWGFHAQQLAGDPNSIKCVSNVAYSSSDAHDCVPPDTPGGPQEVVPEPATMTLLATGLAGLAAANRRRRKKLQD